MVSRRLQADRIACPPVAGPKKGVKSPAPSLWNQLDPSHQQQLAQRLAELIRRIPQAAGDLPGGNHERE